MLIRTRLILIGFLPLLLLLIFVVGALVTQRQLDLFREKVVVADNLGKNLFDLIIIEHDLVGNKSDRPRQQWPSLMQALESKLMKAKGVISSADERELMETLLEHFANSQRDFQELDQWLDRYHGQTLSTVQQDYIATLSERLHVNLQSAIPIANLIASINQQKAVAFDQRRENVMIFTLFFLTCLILLILYPLIRGITRSVAHLKTSMNQAALGDLEFHIAMTGKDEFAQLARDFNEMISKLAENTVARRILSSEVIERRKAEAELRIAAAAFASQESMMVTDAKGVILRVNQAFTATTGYTAEEAVGKTPSILKSGRHNADFYRAMWETIHRDGTWQGEVWDRRKNGEVFPKLLTITAVTDEDGVISNYVGLHIDMTERKAAEDEIQSLAFYDPLTRLPNRRLLMDRIRLALVSSKRSGREGAVLFIDLDDFKTLNDTMGHDVGDLLLQQVAMRLASCVREGDTVARLGGDEFVVMLEDLSEHNTGAATQTEIVGEKILAALNQPYQLGTYECRNTPSIGITLFNGNHSGIEELLKQADIALYQAKNAGRNALRFFDSKMQDAINARASLESELRKALENRQFHLYYQIQVDSSNQPLGAEVLIRWIHPVRGMVSPDQFIPLAEEMGLMLPIGQWVLETACAQIKTWQQDALTCDLVLAVNMSARQFRQTDFVMQVKATLQRHGINPARLKLELTESLLLENVEDIIAKMNALNEIGVQFSLDDFGTGYSSLQYLKRLPLDQLKIDQSFVRDIAIDSSDKAIVCTIIVMARSLNLDVIAEGVETEEQRQLLLGSGCTRYQGYLFSKPIPIEQFEVLLVQG